MTLGAVQIAEKEAAKIMSKIMEKMFDGGALSHPGLAVKLDNHGPQRHIFTMAYDWFSVDGDSFGIDTSVIVNTRIHVKEKNSAEGS